MEQNLATFVTLKEITKKYGFQFTKSLGQNFLVDTNILQKIVDSADIQEKDIVIEIGTGIGTLTRELAKRAKKVYAIEIDKNLIPIVKETTSNYNNIDFVNMDFLEVVLEDLIQEKDRKIKVIANIPYYITTPIIMKCLESSLDISTILLMIQKEVADRLSAEPSTKAYGSLSVAVQYYSDVEFVGKVSKSCFYPQPKVDSGIVKLSKKHEYIFVRDRELFSQVVKSAFAKRRKTISNSMIEFSEQFTKDNVMKALGKSGTDAKRRGETLTVEEFAHLSNCMFEVLN